MATYTSIAASDIDAYSPLKQELIEALAHNPTAIAEGATGAPSIEIKALNTSSTSTDGSIAIPPVSTYLIPAGVYQIVPAAQVVLELFISSAWRTTTYEAGGIVISDGTTARFNNLGGSLTRTVYYKLYS